MATVMLLIGGVAALGVLLTRWETVHLLSAEWFYRILTVHGLTMLIFVIIFFEMAVLVFAGPVPLGSRVPAPEVAWAGVVLMVARSVLAEVVMWMDKADVLSSADKSFRIGAVRVHGKDKKRGAVVALTMEKRHVLNTLGAWTHTTTREMYQQEGHPEIALQAAETRRKTGPRRKLATKRQRGYG